MSEPPSPIEMMFEMQRESIKQTEDVIENVFEISTAIGDSVASGVDAQREFQEQTLELARDSVHRSLDAAAVVSETSPEAIRSSENSFDELRENVDTTFDTLLDQQKQAFDVVDEQYEDFNEDAFDNLETQIDLLIDASERFETQLFESVERFVEQAEEADVFPAGVENQFESLGEQLERQADRFNDLEEQFATIEISTEPGE